MLFVPSVILPKHLPNQQQLPPQPTTIAMASRLVKFIWKFRRPKKPEKAWKLKQAAWDTIKNIEPDVCEILIRFEHPLLATYEHVPNDTILAQVYTRTLPVAESKMTHISLSPPRTAWSASCFGTKLGTDILYH
jgi:hypothetical protein